MKHKADHPSIFLDADAIDIIRRTSAEAEQLSDLHPDQLNLIYDRKWFKMFIPKSYGGLALSLPEVLRLEEALSWADGSIGWVVTLCGGAGWFSGFLEPSLLREIVSDEKVCFAGSGATTGVADKTNNGYRISGRWKYASGSLHATVFTANCLIQKEGVPEVDDNGAPLIAPFLFYRNEVMLNPVWKSMGMIATGSHSFEVNNILVPEDRRFTIGGRHAILKDAFYQYPFLQLAQTTLAVNLSGMAASFMDHCETMFSESRRRQDPTAAGGDATGHLARAWLRLGKLRYDFFMAAQASARELDRGRDVPAGMLNRVSKTSYALAHGALRLVDELYPYCGLAAADPRSDINRVWRNIHTASQHALFRMG